ncbi:hypothetical protein [Lunatimonas salinarum]|uniref:hypothetical protein n=1 Tax=Lunatimonas salinarum TaxID=1774590 RepID=UPI001ADF7847|nr:hypothetical protein [Lunatimonas salinarum]
MKVRIEDLETSFREIFSSIKEELGKNEIEISEDFYWHIVSNDLYNIDQKPENHSIGSLSDDLNEIKRIANMEYSPVRQNLVKLNSILRYIAEKE